MSTDQINKFETPQWTKPDSPPDQWDKLYLPEMGAVGMPAEFIEGFVHHVANRAADLGMPLTRLYLQGNGLTKLLARFNAFPLVRLDISQNSLSEIPEATIGELS